MDWKLEQKRKEKAKAGKQVEFDKDVNILGEMELDFMRIFGAGSNAALPGRRGKAGDHVRRSEISNDRKRSGA